MSLVLFGIIALLCLICVALWVKLAVIKSDLRSIAMELRFNRDIDYNRRLTVDLVDRDLTALAAELNDGLQFQRKLKEGNELAEQKLRQSVSDIAHDLRTPLTVINGSLQLLEPEVQSDPKSLEYVRICREKTGRLKKMTDDFFELSLLECEGSLAVMERINATKLLMQFIADNEAVIREHELLPDIRLPERSVFMMGDAQLTVRVLENLLNNVVKYAREGFRIALSEDGERCRIAFANKAYGLGQSDVEHLFERSYRASKSRSGSGAGLGLYIVRLLMDKQGGAVSAELKDGELVITAEFERSAE